MSPMHVLRNLLLCIAAALAGTAPCAAKAPARQPAFERKIDDYLQPVLRTNNFAGVVVVAKGDTILFQKGFGAADLEHRTAHRPGTLFQIASVTKPFTAAAVMLLAERGAIDLKAPLAKLLPGYPNGDKLTVHHLLTHTSGIPNINDFPEYEDVQYRHHTPEQLVAYFKDKPLLFAPGSEYRYSNSNYNLLAYIIERVSGVPYGTFIEREVVRRLGLTGTAHHRDMQAVIPDLADGYAPRGMTGLERARYIDWSVKTGNGSLYSNAADIMRFVRAVHTGRLLDVRSMAASFTEHTPNVGYGWFLAKANNRALHHINGRSPGWAAQVDYYPADQVTVVVLSNTYSSVTTPIARAVGALFFGEPHKPFPDLGRKPAAAEIAPLLGTYRFGPDYPVANATARVAEREGDLYLDVPGQPPAALIPTEEGFIIRPFWMNVKFVRGPDGRVRELAMEPFRAVRVE